MANHDEARFRLGVDAAMKSVKTILDNTRNPQYPEDVPHTYDDKYVLAEFLTRTATAAILQCLGSVGLTDEALEQLIGWAKTRSVTLRFQGQASCSFLREETHQVESAQQAVVEKRSLWGGVETTTGKIVTTVREYFWSFEFKYELIAFQGNMLDQAISLHTRSGRIELKTGAKTPPRPENVIRTPLDANITWLLGQIDAQHRASFAIDRTSRTCHTPRRNDQIAAALSAFGAFSSWCGMVHGYFLRDLFTAQPDHGRDLSAIHARDVFVPVVPLFEAAHGLEAAPGKGVAEQSTAYSGPFLAEQARSLAARCAQLAQIFPRDTSLITVTDAVLMVTLLHAIDVCQRFSDGVDHIETMLHDQLIAAIGKELTPADFSAYMDFHHRKLFLPEFRPRPFSHAIRRPEHYPEGVVSIEADQGEPSAEPISTTFAWSEARHPMTFALDAATRVSFYGDRFLHAWVSHQFSGRSSLSLSLVARARQFSSFILLVGRIGSADTFDPKFGIIVQNKDLLKIPLMLEQIPTPKEFRDAIESLSPEQQRFAKAFRGMQLESTLFGVCVIQIKPQLEALLNLPPDSLTKEIKLTQDLLSLFIEYQIPSDLISYDGPAEASQEQKLAKVSEHVSKMLAMIAHSRAREIEEARERESLRLAEANRTQFAAPPPFSPAPPMMSPVAAPAPGGMGYGGPPKGAPPMSGAAPMPSPSRAAPSPPPAMRPAAPPAQAAPPPPPPAPQAAPAAKVASAPVAHASQAARPHEPAHRGVAPSSTGDAGVVDYTRIPAELDKKFDVLDEDSALHPTIITPGDRWSLTSQKGLLSAPVASTLSKKEREGERNKAFDLLDALSRSGALPIHHASLHVVIAATHCFDKTLIDTVIEDNVNPIEKVERSVMIVATTIHDRPAAELLAAEQAERFLTANRQLGPAPSAAPAALPGAEAGQTP
jgi:hypothetical protein